MLLNIGAVSATEDDSEARGYYNDGKLINGESILDRKENIHKLFLQRKIGFGTEKLVDIVAAIADE